MEKQKLQKKRSWSVKMENDRLTEIIISDEEEREKKIHDIIRGRRSLNINETLYKQLTLRDRMADKLASFIGSWAFIGCFCILIVAWIAINTEMILRKPLDPFPYVFMNFVLAFISSLQAPVIMMSQNREATKDRLRAENDYLINMKSEIILEDLHFKIDDILNEQRKLKKELKELKMSMIEQSNGFQDGKGDLIRDDERADNTGRKEPGLHH
jgi:uncharacterized membrane protein